MPLTVKLTTDQQVTVRITPVTPRGQPAKLDGVPTWSVAVGGATLNVAKNGLSAAIVSPDVPGESQVLISADADLGAGVETISDTVDVNVVGQNATALGLVAETPVTKP